MSNRDDILRSQFITFETSIIRISEIEFVKKETDNKKFNVLIHLKSCTNIHFSYDTESVMNENYDSILRIIANSIEQKKS